MTVSRLWLYEKETKKAESEVNNDIKDYSYHQKRETAKLKDLKDWELNKNT